MVKIPDEWEITPEEKAAYAATNPLDSAAMEESAKATAENVLYYERARKIALLSQCGTRKAFILICWLLIIIPIMYYKDMFDPIVDFVQSFTAS